MPWQSINPLSEPKGLTMSCRREVLEAKDKLGVHNVSWRCPCCRWRLPVTSGVPFFDDATWPHLALLAMWNCCEGVDVTTTVRQLNVGDDWVRRWCRRARSIMTADALRIQSTIQLGDLKGIGGEPLLFYVLLTLLASFQGLLTAF